MSFITNRNNHYGMALCPLSLGGGFLFRMHIQYIFVDGEDGLRYTIEAYSCVACSH